ncbi:MAG: hypothetical protein ABR66_04855 [Microbacteriaceae bacterium BACL25 MAG-120322-bin65]|jgi:thioredoxin-related protein|nr:MAG: hypothetical protein ABR66_04855 [Microbacteriaceae bacterium BACL25 MAG-120322-bin65]
MDTVLISLIVVALIIFATLLGFAWENSQGVITRDHSSSLPADVPPELVDPNTRLTLVQFSGPFCSYCAAMRRVLGKAVEANPGIVSHREVDITDVPELTRSLRISQTPTTLLVSHTGHLISRINGAAKPDVVNQEIARALESRKAQSDEYLI